MNEDESVNEVAKTLVSFLRIMERLVSTDGMPFQRALKEIAHSGNYNSFMEKLARAALSEEGK